MVSRRHARWIAIHKSVWFTTEEAGIMARGRKKVDTSPSRVPLTDNPFEGLRSPSAGEIPAAEPLPADDEKRAAPARRPFSVSRTRKGGFPIHVEKRRSGKQVTVISGVEGDAAALLRILQKRLGSGGTTKGDAVEIQGDHRESVGAILEQLAEAP